MCVMMRTSQCSSPYICSRRNMTSCYFRLMTISTLCILAVNGSEAISTAVPSSSTQPEVNNFGENDVNVTYSSVDAIQWNVTISIDFPEGYSVSLPWNTSLEISELADNRTVRRELTATLNPAENSSQVFAEFDPVIVNNTNTSWKANTETLFGASRELYLRLLEFPFMFLVFIILVCAIRTCIRRQSMKCYSLIIDFFLASLAVSRTLTLFLEPTSGLPSDTTSTVFLALFNLPFPSLLASFTLVFFSILHLTKIHAFNSPAQTSFILLVLIILQFFSVLFLDIFLHYFSGGNQIPIGELTFSLWFWLFSVIFFYYFRQLRFVSLRKQSEIMRFTFTKLHIEGARLPSTLPYSPLKLVIALIFISVVLTLILTFLLVSNVIMKLGVHNDDKSFKMRFIVSVTCRILEITISFILLYITMQPLDVAINKSIFSNCTCSDICGDKTSLGDDIYPTNCTNNSAVARTKFTFEHWNSKNNYTSQRSVIDSSSLGVKSVAESASRRHVTLSSLATLSSVHSHLPMKLCGENNRNNSNLELDLVVPITPRKSPARNLFNAMMLKRCGSSDSSGFDVHLQRKSPITKTEELNRRRSGGSTPAKDCRKIPNLNLCSVQSTKQPQDITPDSAVDLEFPSDVTAYPQLPLSHSMNDLQAGYYGFHTNTRSKGLSHSLLSRFRSSTFSLSSHRGYEQFDSPQPHFRKNWEMKTAFRGSNASSRMSRDVHSCDSDGQSSPFSCQCERFNSVVCVSTEVQTEPFDFIHQVVVHSNRDQ